MGMELNDSILAFVDILGFRKLIENKEDSEKLFEVIENIKNQNTEECRIEHSIERGNVLTMKTTPALSSFSDCIAISIPMKEVKAPFRIGNVVNSLLGIIQQLADSLMLGGYVLRGGIARGELHHKNGVVFGKALIEAYELESKKAIVPRILVSEELAKEYNETMYDANNFLIRENVNNKNEGYSLNYLKLSFQDEETRERYKSTTEKTIRRLKDGILYKVNHGDISNLEEDVKVLKNWLYFNEYVNNTVKLYGY